MAEQRQPTVDGLSIVLIGAFNPAIFHPSWFALNGLLRKTEADEADIQIVHPEAAIFTSDWLSLQVTKDRLSFETQDPTMSLPLRDLAIGTLQILEHSPARQFGINRYRGFDFSPDELTDFLAKFVNASAWGAFATEPRVREISVECEPQDSRAEFLRVKLEATGRRKAAVTIHTNQHYQATEEESSTAGTFLQVFFSVLSDEWVPFLRYAEHAISSMIERTTD
jgi:hypothetical protein